MENAENQLTVIDEDGNETLCRILFTFHSDEFNKDYVVFYRADDEENEDVQDIQLMAASYVEAEGGAMGELQEVASDEEWELLEEVIEEYSKQTEEADEQPLGGSKAPKNETPRF